MNQPKIGDRYQHYSGVIYTFTGFTKSIELTDQDLIIASNSLIALQDETGHIIVRPLYHLSDIMHNGKAVQEYSSIPDGNTYYYRYQKLEPVDATA